VKATAAGARVYLTDGDGYRRRQEDHIETPTAGTTAQRQRRREARGAPAARPSSVQTFLGFPDGGLCRLTAVLVGAPGAYRSPYTRLNRPRDRKCWCRPQCAARISQAGVVIADFSRR
jgi:hypothetical protein